MNGHYVSIAIPLKIMLISIFILACYTVKAETLKPLVMGQVLASTCEVPASMILHPTGIAYKNNKLYILGRSHALLFSVDLTGTVQGNSCYHLMTKPKNNTAPFVLPMNLIQQQDDWLVVDPAIGIQRVDKNGVMSSIGSITPSNGFARIDDNDVAVVDRGSATITRFNLQTNKATIISGPIRGADLDLNQPISITSYQGTLYVLDYALKKIFSVDPATGNRKAFINLTQHQPQGIQAKQPLFIKAAKGWLFVTDPQAKQIIKINIKTRQVSLLASNSQQDGLTWGAPLGMTFDGRDKLYVSDYVGSAIYSVNITNGVRHKIIAIQSSPKNMLVYPGQLISQHDGHLVIADERAPALFALDPKDKQLITITSLGKGSGPIMFECVGVGELSNGNLVFSDTFFSQFYQVDPKTGNRTVVKSLDTDIANRMRDPWGMTNDGEKQWYVTDGSGSQIFKMTLSPNKSSESHQLISSSLLGGGPKLENVLGSVLLSNGQLLVANQGKGANNILEIDPANGNRTLFSGKESSQIKGKGVVFKSTAGLSLANNNKVILTDSGSGAVFSINLTNGDRKIISGQANTSYIGIGPRFVVPAGLTLAADKQAAYVTDAHMPGIFSVNLTSGQRTLLIGKEPSTQSLDSP